MHFSANIFQNFYYRYPAIKFSQTMCCSVKNRTIIFILLWIVYSLVRTSLYFAFLLDPAPQFSDFLKLLYHAVLLGLSSFGLYAVMHNKTNWIRYYARFLIAMTIVGFIEVIFLFLSFYNKKLEIYGYEILNELSKAIISVSFVFVYFSFVVWCIYSVFATAKWIEQHPVGT